MVESHFTASHTDLSPQKRQAADSNGNNTCPLCGETCWSAKQLQVSWTAVGRVNTTAAGQFNSSRSNEGL